MTQTSMEKPGLIPENTPSQEQPTPAPEKHAGLRAEHPSRILVADDEHLVATELAFTLGSMGYTVVGPVTDGQSAVDLGRRALPDMALLDIRMPKLDGLGAARELSETLDIPCVILSAYSEPEYVEAAGSIGVFGYLVKPVQDDQLRACIDLAWRRYQHFSSDRAENRSLKKRLEERKVVEQAKWILVSTRSMTEPDAMKLLRTRSRDSRRSMAQLAESIIKNNGLKD